MFLLIDSPQFLNNVKNSKVEDLENAVGVVVLIFSEIS